MVCCARSSWELYHKQCCCDHSCSGFLVHMRKSFSRGKLLGHKPDERLSLWPVMELPGVAACLFGSSHITHQLLPCLSGLQTPMYCCFSGLFKCYALPGPLPATVLSAAGTRTKERERARMKMPQKRTQRDGYNCFSCPTKKESEEMRLSQSLPTYIRLHLVSQEDLFCIPVHSTIFWKILRSVSVPDTGHKAASSQTVELQLLVLCKAVCGSPM
ncbi:uncharacterized protein [Equus asinus]|uniref:uncharacterized protein n=1 Tax=Equus asinus TaxID=9793 RepID=UPI0038F77CA5